MEEILVDENGYKQFFEELKRLEDLSRSNSALGSEVYKDAVGDGWHDNFAFEESMRESRAIAKRIDDLLSKKQYLKIVDDKDKKENLVNIGDKVSINIKYSDDDIETEVITLTGNYIPNTTNEISLNSPLGKAVYKKKIGDTCSYSVNNRNFSVLLKQKMDLTKENGAPVKKLKK